MPKKIFTGGAGGRKGYSGGFGTGGVTPVDFLGVVANQAAMLLLVGDKGDWCIRSDSDTVWVIINTPSSLIGNWQQLAYPIDPAKVLADGTDPTPGYLNSKVDAQTILEDAAVHKISVNKLMGVLPIITIFDNTAALPVGPGVGDRYIAFVTANGWTIDNIYQWDGLAWIETVTVDGMLVFNSFQGAYYIYTGGAWFNLLLLAPGFPVVKADVLDGIPGYLDAKVDNSTIEVTAAHVLALKNLGITDAKVAVANKDGAAGTPSMRTIGAGALQACAGDDARLSDARAPLSHAASHEADGSDALTGYDKFYPCVIAAYSPVGGLPFAPAVGDRYISGFTNLGWTVNHIYEWNGATWTDTTPVAKVNILVKGNTVAPHDVASIVGGAVYTYSGAAWQISKYSGTLLIDANDNTGSGFIADKLWSGDGGVVATDGLGHVTFGARNDGVTIDLIGVSPKSIAVKLLGITDAYVAVANKDGAAGTPSMRTIGAGALQACAGNDGRLSDPRTPTAHAASHNLAGVDIITTIPRYLFLADQLLTPNNADWVVNSPTGMSADSLNNALLNRQFDDTTEEGIGFFIEIPAGAVNMTFYFRSRAQTAPGAATTVLPRLYRRQIVDNTVIGAWSAVFAFAQIDIPTNTRFQYDSETVTLVTLGLTAGNVVQMELTRNPADGLVGDWNLLEFRIYFG